MKIFISTVVIFFAAALPVRAGILIEPYFGYHNGTIEYTTTSNPTTLKDTTPGFGVGARLAYTFMIPFIGIDLEYVTGKDKSESGTETDTTEFMAFLMAGAQFPFGFRAFVGYAPLDTIVSKTTPEITLTGSAVKLGVGYKFNPFMAINAEYIIHSTTKYKTSGVEGNITDIFPKYNYNSYLVTLSFPLPPTK